MWTTADGTTSTDSIIKTNVILISETLYKVAITNANNVGEASVAIKIDKQPPIVTNIEYDKNWTSNDKNVTITVDDYAGSGIAGIYVGTNPNCDNSLDYKTNIVNNKYKLSLGNGKYYVCVKDKAGNLSDKNSDGDKVTFEISTVYINPIFNIANSDLIIEGISTTVSTTYSYNGDGIVSCESSGVYSNCKVDNSSKTITFTKKGIETGSETFNIKASAGAKYAAANKNVKVTVKTKTFVNHIKSLYISDGVNSLYNIW